MDKRELVKNYLGLNISQDSFKIGDLEILDSENIVIEVCNRYYDYCKRIYDEMEKELINKDIVDYRFKYKILNEVKKKFFPRYRDFEVLFNGSDFRNDYLSELSFFPKVEYQRKEMIKGHKLSKELYIDFLKYYAPTKLKKAVSQKIPITLNLQDLEGHSFIVGKTGYGKTTLILELAKNIIDKKETSLLLIEPHGDISLQLTKLANPCDLVFIDPFMKKGFVPTINIFEIEDKSLENISIYAGVIVSVFKKIIGGEFSSAMESLLTPVVSVLLQIPNSSFLDMLRFLSSDNANLLKYAQTKALNPIHREYFKNEFLEKRASVTKFSISSRLSLLLQEPVFANMLTGKSTIDLEKLINTKGKVIVIRLNTIKMTSTIESIGKFLTAVIMAYAFKRESRNINKRVPTHMFIDEAKVFLSDSISTILEQARKFKLFLHLSSQHNHILGTDINNSILSNTSLKFVSVNSNKNHRIMSAEIGVPVEKLDSLRKKGEFYIKLGTKKAFKFQVSDRLLDRSCYMTNKEFEEVKKQQLEKYYRKISLKDIQYADIPKVESLEQEKYYSKESTNKLLSALSSNTNDVELLEY